MTDGSEYWEELGGQPTRPAPKLKAAAPKPIPAHRCNHPDGHTCPWLDDLDPFGRARRCGCAEEGTPP